MQNRKPVINRNTRSKPLKLWRLSKEGAVILIFATMLISLASTSYIVGQFEIKPSTLILNRDGCIHLIQLGINPQRQPDSDTCRLQLPFRPNPLDAGGRIWAGERIIKIPESQLIGFSPLAEQPWTSHHWFLMAWEIGSVLLVLLSMWLTERCLQREDHT